VPGTADIAAIEVAVVDGKRDIRVRTRTPGHLIGRQGGRAQEVRDALAAALDDPSLRLSVAETSDP
jgi:ribosomal protein S3